MSDGRPGPIGRLLDAERRLHEAAPIRDGYSRLLVRTLLWFAFFSLVAALLSGL
ncbi:hypothetical protein [Natrinema salifodinae]|uniref:Uncharacterized protein n=1 Tax=Natrinema salifodinae TaxID=1202768 RepID=A0A1I0LX00_9EURY|nr:hypothetical protein [Natrinema salifodinae]SEV79960.1 hypothetical protein SAMN05216285_0050 [Natrinema salifodinae]